MIVVTTPTGKIGSHVVKHLLAAKERVRVIARDASRLAPELLGHVEVIQGSSDDDDTMVRALDSAEALFLVVPPSFKDTNDTHYYPKFTLPACRAVVSQRVKRVVAVSGLGRDVRMEAGPVTASFRKDEAIEKTGVDFRALWCPSFMDNMLGQIPTMKSEGRFFLPAVPELKARHVATWDIAEFGADLLLDRSWSGQGGTVVLEPEGLSFNDMARRIRPQRHFDTGVRRLSSRPSMRFVRCDYQLRGNRYAKPEAFPLRYTGEYSLSLAPSWLFVLRFSTTCRSAQSLRCRRLMSPCQRKETGERSACV